MKRILIVTALLLASGTACPAFYSTGYLAGLLESCGSLPETFEANQENITRVKDCGLSTGYILGIYDANNALSDRAKCFPSTLPSEQAVAAVENWIRQHPERSADPADQSVRTALDEAWTCPQ